MSKDGVFYQRPSHPLRYYLYFSTKEENIENITNMVITESKMAAKSNEGEMFTFLNNFECPVLDVSASPSEEDPSSNELFYTFEVDGVYFLYIFINEEAVDNGRPVVIEMAKSKQQEELEKDVDAARKRKEELRKQKEEANMRRLLAEQQEKEERERRRLETRTIPLPPITFRKKSRRSPERSHGERKGRKRPRRRRETHEKGTPRRRWLRP
jgi:molecular chaperone DnaK (HSP70)